MANAWLAAADRNAVVAAEAEVARSLASRPGAVGREIHEELRELVAEPLRVVYTVSEPDRIANVERVVLVPGHARADRHGGNGRPGD